jgi:drug/metabolite transporter (DMT)-like permease
MVKLRGYGLLVVLATIWGLAFVAIRRADAELAPVNLTLLRWIIVSASFLILYPFMAKPKTRFERKDVPRLLVVSLTSVTIYHLALNTAETTVDASLAGLLISLSPLLVVVLSSVLLREKVTWKIGLGLAFAMAGAVVISWPDLSLGTGTLTGPVLVVVSAAASATFTVTSKPLVGKYGPYPVALWAAVIGTAVLLPLLSPSLIAQAEALSIEGWTSVLYLALLSTVVANIIFFTLVGRQAVSKLGVQLYLVPLVSVAGGTLILGEALNTFVVAGGALLLAAVALATHGGH